MYSRISKPLLIGMLMFASVGSGFSQSVKLRTTGHGRPGFGAGVDLEIVRGNITGPVRFVMELPKGWNSSSYLLDPRVTIRDVQGKSTALWLSFPTADTVRYSYGLQIPVEQALGPVMLQGHLEYFDQQGKKHRIPSNPYKMDIVRYYSRFQ